MMNEKPNSSPHKQITLALALIPVAGFLYVIIYEASLLLTLGLSLTQIPISTGDLASIGMRKTPHILSSIFGIAMAEFLVKKSERGQSADILGKTFNLFKEYWWQTLGVLAFLLLFAGIASYLQTSWKPILLIVGLFGGVLLAEFLYDLFSIHLQNKTMRYVVLWFSILVTLAAADGASWGLDARVFNRNIGYVSLNTDIEKQLPVIEVYDKGVLIIENNKIRFVPTHRVSSLEWRD